MSDWTDLDAAEEESNPDAGWEDDALEEDADAQAGEAKEADEDAVAPAGDDRGRTPRNPKPVEGTQMKTPFSTLMY